MWPYNFLHFSQQYTVHIMARCGKNRAGVSHMRVCGLQRGHFPRQICVYILWSRGSKRQRGLVGSSRLESTTGISFLWWTQTWLKLAQTARHSYDAICAHNLFAVYHIGKLPTDNRTLFYDGKNVWMYTNLLRKMWLCKRIFIWKMWMMLTLILI